MTSAQKNRAHEASVENYRQDFPALQQTISGHPLVYLDSASSAQQPASVIETVAEYQRNDHSNVHRGVHTLSHRATEAYEGARDKIQGFINAASRNEIIHTSGTTESINLVAQSYCPKPLAISASCNENSEQLAAKRRKPANPTRVSPKLRSFNFGKSIKTSIDASVI